MEGQHAEAEKAGVPTDFITLLNDYARGLKYQGLNVQKIRKDLVYKIFQKAYKVGVTEVMSEQLMKDRLVGGRNEMESVVTTLSKLLIAHAQAGNKPTKLIRNMGSRGGAQEQGLATEVVSLTQDLGIDAGSGMSLNSVAIAFISAYSSIRQLMAQRGALQSQFSSVLDVQFQTPAMGPLAEISGQKAEYFEWQRRFTRALEEARIRKDPTLTKMTRENLEEEIQHWHEISVAGFQQDALSQSIQAKYQTIDCLVSCYGKLSDYVMAVVQSIPDKSNQALSQPPISPKATKGNKT